MCHHSDVEVFKFFNKQFQPHVRSSMVKLVTRIPKGGCTVLRFHSRFCDNHGAIYECNTEDVLISMYLDVCEKDVIVIGTRRFKCKIIKSILPWKKTYVTAVIRAKAIEEIFTSSELY